MESIVQEIERLRKMPAPDLLARYEAEFGKPPRVKNACGFWRRIAWKVQERKIRRALGDGKEKSRRVDSQIDLPLTEQQRTVSGVLKKPRKPGAPPIGTVISRRWHGEELQLRVVDQGFELKGVTYKTLSEAARSATGRDGTGHFFGASTQRKKSSDYRDPTTPGHEWHRSPPGLCASSKAHLTARSRSRVSRSRRAQSRVGEPVPFVPASLGRGNHLDFFLCVMPQKSGPFHRDPVADRSRLAQRLYVNALSSKP